jgi:DNA topoisomerase I
MVKNLVIVESPAKAKTIEKFLGKDYTVKSCFGHVRDLAEGDLSVDVKDKFKPKYVVPDEKKKVVSELKKLAKEAEIIWLATDEDREGEAISWHLLETLDLEEDRTRRIVFHEITKNAILKAIENPRSIDHNLVNAQQARRILDRLVGFELSPVLWKKIQPALSAGRVQSVAVRLIVEREREINNFTFKSSYKVTASFHTVEKGGKVGTAILKAELPKNFETKAEARHFLEDCLNASYKVSKIEVKPIQKSPPAPFTTSTLQQEASRKLGFSVTRTMVIAQKLYEAGHITYMRTDSVNLSEEAIGAIKKEVTSLYGAKYASPRRYTTKSSSAQEAHEAIRPTYASNQTVAGDRDEQRLYDLIWKRTVASQMAKADLERTDVTIDITTRKEQFRATGEVLIFDGFLKVYLEQRDDEDEEDEDIKGMLPPVSVGQMLQAADITATERYNRPSARYTEATLVRKLEELGIGRPSTYAPTITTIQKRGYVVKGDQKGEERPFEVVCLKKGQIKEQTKKEVVGREKSKLFPTNIGIVVNDFLILHFKEIMDYQFTATVEKEFDEIAQGDVVWEDMLEDFYKPFHKHVEHTTKETERVKSERKLGVDPASGKPVLARIGKFGPMVQIGETTDEQKPRYARMRKDQLLETITLEEALELFRLPRELGNFEGEPVVINIGRFGPYVAHNKAFYSLGKDDDPYAIDMDKAIEIITTKRTEKENKVIAEYQHEGKPLQVLNGRYGPYIAWNKTNYKIPKGTDPKTLNQDEAAAIIASQPDAGKSKGRRSRKK